MSGAVNFMIGGGLIFWMILTMALTNIFHVKSQYITVVRMGLMLLGTVIAGLLVYWNAHRQKAAGIKIPGAPAIPGVAADTDVDVLLKQAEQKLATSNLGPEARFRTLPVFFLTGPPGAAKTSTVLQSGLEPELLAGNVYQEGAVLPTGLANVWYAKQSILVEAGGALQNDAKSWTKMIKRLAPGKLKSALQKGEAAPRAAVICFECDNFMNQGAAEKTVGTAKALRNQLGEVSKVLGINLPVYVLFTKMDRIAFFLEYVRTLNSQEATQVVGMTLPIMPPQNQGVYGEMESRRLGDAFQRLVFGLCDKRPDFLVREGDPNVLPATYEFPREFRKLRGPMVQFLVELCRPSQLSTGPFLRGFYFTGVRPMVVQQELAAEAPRFAQGGQQGFDPGATRMFSYGEAQGRGAAAPMSRSISKKVPQWIFLSHLFGDVILVDKTALGASGSSVKASLLRRILFGTAAGLCLILGAFTLTSYLKNHSLVNRVRDAAQGVKADSAKQASLESLTRLDTLRSSLVDLRDWEDDGAPYMMRWGLYTGSSLLPEARRLYCDRFKLLLLNDLQSRFLKAMQSYPPTPPPGADYPYSYDTLKIYLETTSNPDKATLDFLPAKLQDRWATANPGVDPARLKLARAQFDFYTTELKAGYCAVPVDAPTVDGARRYLALFGDDKRIYQQFLTNVNHDVKSINFNQTFPGSAAIVIDNKEVQGAFTKPGYAKMISQMNDPASYRSGEEWVLGPKQIKDPMQYKSAIKGYYETDYIEQWRDYLRKAIVVRYATLKDAVEKLLATSGVDSPLMALFWLCTDNTNVDDQAIKDAFAVVQNLVPPSQGKQFVGAPSQKYISALGQLQSTLDAAAKVPADQAQQAQTAADATSASATAAHQTVRDTTIPLGRDPSAQLEKVVEKLMHDPITYAEAVKPEGPSPAPLNAGGAALCGQFKALFAKYPFNPAATPSNAASLDEVNALFQPGSGSMWAFYDNKLKDLLVKQGNVYIPTSKKPTITARFADFFTRAAAFANGIYPGGTGPKFNFTMKPNFSAPLAKVSITIDGQKADLATGGPPQQFSWPGSGGVAVTPIDGQNQPGGSSNYPGTWAIFEYFYDADKPGPTPEWRQKQGKSDRSVNWPNTDTPVVVSFAVDGAPWLVKGYFQSLGCEATVASGK